MSKTFTREEKNRIVILTWLEGLSQHQEERRIGELIRDGYSEATCRAILNSEPGINYYLRPKNETEAHYATATDRTYDIEALDEAIDPIDDNIEVVWEDDFSSFFGSDY